MHNRETFGFVHNRDTAFNIAFPVESIQAILDKNSDIQVIVTPRIAIDENGSVEYACIKSCIGNVVHTLINASQYEGPFLPGFIPVTSSKPSAFSPMMIHSVDHTAFAISKQSGLSDIAWFKKVFGMERFFVNREEDPLEGFTVRVGQMGMRLFALDCGQNMETIDDNTQMPDLKLVFAESMAEDSLNSRDQITSFIIHHENEPGIQHLAFQCVNDIKSVVRTAKANGAQFLLLLPDYYFKENKGCLIERAGDNVSELAELGILLDSETGILGDGNRILLRIFTKSIFNNETLFLELIERRHAAGFGADNIRTLWKIVQQQIEC